MRKAPGYRNSQRGYRAAGIGDVAAISPATQVRWAVAPVGDSVVGTSTIRSPYKVALTTISLANSIPVVRRTESHIAALLKPRSPQ